ncbi:MAG: 3-deoxy-7-phosphoheptulonate synthase [Candidatus Thioglobus sp.]|uniref:3-deoxy-7-phosphoheptulonate synthase n=1 Tax=Candidatus Thioglobus sp. TaxID=2026721 RepID=UPI0001BD391E|nr:3-deoxy-7-phosphoheptulonate synthase [Candidatus Thioglobus sp.]EEZ79528.1 MAG: 3-deoxy-D-arabino-heptulosonate 7-phosphate (DAHP) synthase [uncultured Candidatus Thioglobus sp.]MBT3186279.1 3-deoxy-7-phosphoheptulonate synthase [Candidatus Thioglobus sp.]MBT3431313.1 3-deoxy-7-phosphoheptulonate synthase [Candidatus Thioglobus sp.]MBT3964957.1 3-deoxy-7-phosphoheptulonate synthase [Candidatus Thioglobus sp.]MBT4316224.1 3-deoxy-7-phosphoheptulonate synthase [Candidatus Thioglobus sp.]
MQHNTDNLRITSSAPMIAPNELMEKYPLGEKGSANIFQARQAVKDILEGKDHRLMVIVGPCSIHDSKSAREYADKLAKVKEELKQDLLIVMRVYFEKPRTTVGWKGLINDPDLDESFNIDKGLKIARHLLTDLADMNMPVAVEYLDLITPQYISDLISWGAIGARTTESQSHRELASALSCPVGFKNGTTGSLRVAIDAIKSANSPHHLLSVNKEGGVSHYTSSGNETAHIILRGGADGPNYDSVCIKKTYNQLKEEGLLAKIMVDFSHANSQKKFKNQLLVGDEIAKQISTGSDKIFGVMIESHLNEGNQAIGPLESLKYGVSITDSCIGWDDTENLLKTLAQAVQKRNA